MKIDKFEVTEKEGQIHVYIEIPHYDHLYLIPKISLSTADVEKLLEHRGIRHGKCIKDSYIKNWRHATRKNEWIFEFFVDKPAESVILEEEKSVQPKPKRQRGTRSSAKKVSTEE